MATLTTSWKNYSSSSFSTGSSTVTFYLQARYTSQSTANNTTHVETRLRYSITRGYDISGAGYKFTCTYASTVSGSGTYTFSGTDKTITSGSKTVTHKTDGTQTISLAATAYNKYWNFNKSMSATVSLPTIERLATITSGNDFVLDGSGGQSSVPNNPTIKFTNPAGFQLQPYLEIYKGSSKLATITRTKGTYSSPYNFNLTESERNNFIENNITANDYTVREGITTYNGSSNIGSNYKNYSMDIVGQPEANYSYQDTNPATIAITGDNQKIIRNQSTLQIDFSNIVIYKNAPIATAKATYNSTTYAGTISGDTATIPVGTINSSEDVEIIASIIDTRGNSFFRFLDITILDWQLPTANITLERQNNFYSETDITVDANYSSLDGNNTIDIKVRTKKTTDSTYGSYTSLSDNVTTTLTLDNLYEWDVQVLVADRLGSTTYNLQIGKGMPIIYFDRLNRSVGVDCFPVNQETLEIQNQDVKEYIEDTGWITITPTNGTAATGYYVPQYRKIGKHVTMRGYITVRNNTAMFNLPEEYRPSARLTFAGTNDNRNVNEIRVTEAGDVRLLGTTGTLSSGVPCFLDNVSYFID